MIGGEACPPVAAIVLAAGAATRMGQSKQLMLHKGKPLVQIAIEAAKGAGFSPVVVVVGAEADAVRAAVAAQPVEVVQNEKWRAGMGSSIVAGIRHLQQNGAESYAVAILLADQPLVRAEHLVQMRRLLSSSSAPAVAARYDKALGVPALFKRQLFRRLTTLAPDAGARHLLRDSELPVAEFDLPEAAVDIDTPEDYKALDC